MDLLYHSYNGYVVAEKYGILIGCFLFMRTKGVCTREQITQQTDTCIILSSSLLSCADKIWGSI